MANIFDVAKLASVSKTTVSRVINKQGPVRKSTRERIIKAMKTLNYSPNYFAKGMRTNKTRTIGVVVPDIANPFYPEMLKGIEDVTHAESFMKILCSTNEDADRELWYLKNLVDRSIDGLIMCTWSKEDRNMVYLEELGKSIPIVFMDYIMKSEPVSYVITDGFTSSRFATNYLLKKGKKKIGYIRGLSRFPAGYERFLGYKAAFKDHNLPVDPSLVFEGEYHKQGGYDGAEYFMGLSHPPDAIMTASDIMAIGSIFYLKEHRIGIPEEVSVVGFDNMEMCTLVDPALTTIAQPIRKLGKTAAEILINSVIDGTIPQAQVILDNTLIIRKSLDPKIKGEKHIPIPGK